MRSSCFSYRQQRSWQMAARKENKPEYQSIRASDYLSVSSKKKLQQQHLISLVVTHLHVTVVCSAWGLIQPSLSPRPHPLHPQVLRREVLIPPFLPHLQQRRGRRHPSHDKDCKARHSHTIEQIPPKPIFITWFDG